jgi:hypothetical protein
LGNPLLIIKRISRLYRRENYGIGKGAPKMINTKMTYVIPEIMIANSLFSI